MSGKEMFGVFFQDNQISGMSHSVDPSLSLTSFDMQTTCLQPKLGFICLNESPIGIIREFFRFTITIKSGVFWNVRSYFTQSMPVYNVNEASSHKSHSFYSSFSILITFILTLMA